MNRVPSTDNFAFGVLSVPYRMAVATRNSLFNTGIRKPHHLGRPTLSVGNLTTGGTGKTPMVIELTRRLVKMGHHPAILLRGYTKRTFSRASSTSAGANGQTGSSSSPAYAPANPANLPMVASATTPAAASTSASPVASSVARPASDEARLLKDELRSLALVVPNPNRVAAAAAVLRRDPSVTLFILDDGFQHRQAWRDLDLLLIDATSPWGGGHLLPRGRLREPIENMRRADCIIITRADQVHARTLAEIDRDIKQITGRTSIAHAVHQWAGYVDQHNNVHPTTHLVDQRVACVCGIGNPRAFFNSVTTHGANLVHQFDYPDHHVYQADELLERLRQCTSQTHAQAIVTTDKDWVKWRELLPSDGWPVPVYRPILRMTILKGEDQFNGLLKRALGML